MTDRIRAASDDLLSMHKESIAFVAQQQDLMKKSMLTAFEIGRASFEATTDLQQKMVRNWTDAMVSGAEKIAPAKA
jgi:hypothetical protein